MIAPSRRDLWLAAGLIAAGGAAVYANSLACPFTFDDAGSILENSSIRRLGDLSAVLRPPFAGGQTVGGRPVLNLSLALNWAISGRQVWSYHLLNALIHVAAGLTLFGLVRRTSGSLPAAFGAALLWTVHPLQTEAVTYTVQRAESLMGLFYLLTLYAFARRWYVASLLACLLGMGTKEVMVTAPVVVLLYDRTFVAGTFRGSWRERRWFYGCLFATWLVLALLLAGTHGRGGSVGYGNAAGLGWWSYALTQFPAIVRYLALSLWPHPLIFDYGLVRVSGLAEVLPAALLVLGLAAVSAWALFRAGPDGARGRAAGFLGASFFIILAPTSSIVPGTTQMIVEHRMYLPLAAVMAGAASLIAAALRRWRREFLFPAVISPLAAVLGLLTFGRNRVYQNSLALWQDTAVHRPESPRVRSYLGAVYLERGQTAKASEQFQRAAAIDPEFPQAHNGLGTIELKAGRVDAAIAQYERALAGAPGYAEARYNLGLALLQADRAGEAEAQERLALAVRPDYPEALNTLGNALFRQGRPAAAVPSYQAAARLDPENVEVRNNLGIALARAGNLREAVAQLQEAVRLRPDDAGIRSNLERVQAVLAAGSP